MIVEQPANIRRRTKARQSQAELRKKNGISGDVIPGLVIRPIPWEISALARVEN